MKTLIFALLVILSCSLFAQSNPDFQKVNISPFAQGDSAQSIGRITLIDSVYWRGTVGGTMAPDAWVMFSNTITAAEKTTESTQYFDLAGETTWKWYESIQFKIESTDSSITSIWTHIGNTAGRITYAIKLDTSGTTTYYYDELGGN